MANGLGISSELITHMKSHPNELVTVNDLMEKLPQYERAQIMNNMANVKRTAGGRQIEQIQTGVWRWNENVQSGLETLTFFILKRNEGDTEMVIMDSDENIYKATYVG